MGNSKGPRSLAQTTGADTESAQISSSSGKADPQDSMTAFDTSAKKITGNWIDWGPDPNPVEATPWRSTNPQSPLSPNPTSVL